MRYALALIGVVGLIGCKHDGNSSPADPPPHPKESSLPLVMLDPATVVITRESAYPLSVYTYVVSGEVYNLSDETMIAPFVRLRVDYDWWECRFEADGIDDPTECFEADTLAPGESIKFSRTLEDYRRDGFCYLLDLDINFNAKWESDGVKVYSQYPPDEAIPEPEKPQYYTIHLLNSHHGCSW